MLRPVSDYIAKEAIPRWRAIVLTSESLISVVVFALFLRYGRSFFQVSPKVGDLTTGLIAYASIALGFCIAGLTISLTLPDRDFAIKLAVLKHKGECTNSYSDLLFVFSWTAFAHWIALMGLFGVILFSESSSVLLPLGSSSFRVWAVALVGGLCTYCLCQFLITLITLSQVGRVYIETLAAHHEKKNRG